MTQYATQYATQYSSYYVHSLGPASVDRVLNCRQCLMYLARMDDLLSRASAINYSPIASIVVNCPIGLFRCEGWEGGAV